MELTLCALVLVRRSLIGSEIDSLRRPSKRDFFDFFCDRMLLLLLLLLLLKLPLEMDSGAGDEGFDCIDVIEPDEAWESIEVALSRSDWICVNDLVADELRLCDGLDMDAPLL